MRFLQGLFFRFCCCTTHFLCNTRIILFGFVWLACVSRLITASISIHVFHYHLWCSLQFALVFHLVQLEHDFVVLHWVLPHLQHESLLVLDEWGNFCKSSCYVQAYGISNISWLYLSPLVYGHSNLHQLLFASTSLVYQLHVCN